MDVNITGSDNMDYYKTERVLRLFLMVGLISFLLWINTASADLDETYKKGLSALKNGEYSQALE